MERCPKCKRMSAHRDIHSKRLLCYSIYCNYIEPVKNLTRRNDDEKEISSDKEGRDDKEN
jgi:hypothetical protein